MTRLPADPGRTPLPDGRSRMTWSPGRLLPRFMRRAAEPEPGYILHYHIYKNAGTSIDRLLAESFGDAWTAFDPNPHSAPARIAELQALRAERPQLQAISSHSTCLAWPGLPDEAACPIVMLRHPADRVRSMHAFAQRDKVQPDHALAQGSLRQYVEQRLADAGFRSGISNYQVSYLSEAPLRSALPWFAEAVPGDLRHAQALLAQWPTLGLVARFAESMGAFQAAYAGRVAGLRLYNVHENASPAEPVGETEAIDRARQEMGADVFARFLEANQLDLELYGFGHVPSRGVGTAQLSRVGCAIRLPMLAS